MIPSFKKDRKRSRDPTHNNSAGSITEDVEGGTKFDFDLDLGSMDGIVDPLRLGAANGRDSKLRERERDEGALAEISIMQVDSPPINGGLNGGHGGGMPAFSNPFPQQHSGGPNFNSPSKRRRHAYDRERNNTASSTNTRLNTASSGRLTASSSHHGEPSTSLHQPALVPDALLTGPQDAMGWKAPDSWVTDKDGHVDPESGSEEDVVVGSLNGNGSLIGSPVEGSNGATRRRPGSAGGGGGDGRSKRKSRATGTAYKLKVHIGSSSNDFRVLSMGLATPVRPIPTSSILFS